MAYSTKNGSTTAIAEHIGETLSLAGHPVDVELVKDVRRIDPYRAVILGSAVYIGRWRPEAVRFVRKHGAALRERAVWLFGSGPLGGPQTAASNPPVVGQQGLIVTTGARAYKTFGGRVTEDTPGFIARSIVKQGRGGDFRDLEGVRAWAREVADEISSIEHPGQREAAPRAPRAAAAQSP